MRRRPPSSPPVAAPDPDARSLRWGWIIWIAACVCAVVLVTIAPSEHLPLLAGLGAVLLLWPLWRGGRWLRDVFTAGPFREWHGNYYEFDGRQIRVLIDGDDRLWMCAADVFDAIGLTGGGRDPSRARLAAGRDGLRRAPGSRLLCFTERGLAAWLERRTDARSAAFGRWLTAQVTGPHQRRLALTGRSERAQGPGG